VIQSLVKAGSGLAILSRTLTKEETDYFNKKKILPKQRLLPKMRSH